MRAYQRSRGHEENVTQDGERLAQDQGRRNRGQDGNVDPVDHGYAPWVVVIEEKPIGGLGPSEDAHRDVAVHGEADPGAGAEAP